MIARLKSAKRRPGFGSSNGYVLVSVLWLLGLVAAAVASMSLFSADSLAVISSSSEKLKTEALARAGLEYAFFLIAGSDPNKGLRGETTWRTDAGAVRLSWTGETGRIDVNLAPPILLSSLLAHLAQDQESAEAAADFIIQHRPKPQATQTSAAESPFRTISELEQSGLSADLVTVLKPYLTVFSGRAQIDPRLAPDEVLAALPEMSEARLRNLLDLRRANSQDANAWQREAGPAAGLLSLDPGNAARIRIDVTLASGFRKTSEVVATHFQDDREPYRILSWDDAPGTSAPDARSGDNR